MTFGSSNRVGLSYMPEATFGVTPVTGNGKNLRMQGETLDFALTKTGDKEIRSDRMETSSTTTGAATAGGIKTHLSYAEYDPLLASLLQTVIAAYGTDGVGTSFVGTFTATTITAGAAPITTSAFTTLVKGQWFKVNAPSDANDGKWLRVSTLTAPTSTVITLDVNTPAVISASVAGTTIAACRMTNGVTQTSFSLERSQNDIAVPLFFTYRGMTPSKFSISFSSGALVEPSFEFMGKDMVKATAKAIPGTLVASQTYEILNAVTGVGFVWENGVPLTGTSIKKLDMSIDNSLRMQDAIGTLGAQGIGSGTLKVAGSASIYLADGAFLDKFLADTYTSFSLSCRDPSLNGYVFTLPKVMITKCTITAGARDTDMMLELTFEAKGDLTNATAALRQAIFIDRLGAAVPISFA